MYQNPKLSTLEGQLETNNPNLAAALAHYQQAGAYDAQARSQLFPAVSGVVDASRDRQSDTRPLRGATRTGTSTAPTPLGCLALTTSISGARFATRSPPPTPKPRRQQPISLPARLSLEARLADDYVSLLGLDREIALLTDTV